MAQVSCAASVASFPLVPSGNAELVGDYMLTCTGGVFGNVVTGDLVASLGTNVANSSQPLLIIDGGYWGTYPGVISGNSVTFHNVAVSAPGGGQRALRITAVRAATSLLGSAGPVGVAVLMTTTFSVSTLAISNPVQIVAWVQGTTPLVQVSVSPFAAAVLTGATQQFTANVTGTSNTAVGWSVNGFPGGNSAAGTISSNGAYTAPSTVPNPANVTVAAASMADSTKSVSAIVTVMLGPAPALTLGSSALNFAFQAGGAAPAMQSVSVGSSGTALSFSASATTTSGGNWLSVTPTGGTTPANLGISVNPAGLGTGTYNGMITVTAIGASNSPQSTSVTLTVSPTVSLPPILKISKAHTGNFKQGQASATYTVSVSNSASAGPTTGAVTVTDTVPASLSLVSMTGTGWDCPSNTCTRSDALNPGWNYPAITVTVNVASNAPSQVSNQATVSGGGSVTATASDVTTITASTVPSIFSGGVVNAASGVAGAVSPGSIAMVLGNFQLSSSSTAPSGPWPTSLGGLSMRFGTVQAPLDYVSGPQVNLQVPWELSGQATTTLAATANGQTSPAQAVTLAPFAPGIFAMNGQGSGQGAILDQSGKVVDSSNPAIAGSTYLSIYCTGLGSVSNQPASGALSPTDPLARTTATPTVTIGGVQAGVQFSGLAPGKVGLYQVNVQVPAGVTGGPAVPVAISIGGIVSNTVTIAVSTAPPATLTSINPASSAAGTILTVVIAGANTSFAQGQTLASFGSGVSVGGSASGQAGPLTVIDPTSATAQVAIDPSAALGPRTVAVTTGTQTASLNNAFTVGAPPASMGPLSIASTLPADGATGVSMTPSIQITFNEPLDPATVNSSTFSLASTRATLPVVITTDSTGMIVTLTPAGVLLPSYIYTVTVGAQVRNAAESPLGNPLTFSFTVVPPATANGIVTASPGLDPTSLSVLSFGGSVSTPDSSGAFSASLSPLGTSLVAAMMPGKNFGFLAVTATGTSANPSAAAGSAAQINTVVSRVHRTRWQVTASPAAASTHDNLVADFQTTAEALVFITPYLFTKDPQKAQVILSAIASNPATTLLAQALAKTWIEADPLSDPSVQSALQNAELAVVQALGQQTPALDAGNSYAPASASPVTVAMTPNCRPNPNNGATGLPCLDLDYLNFQGTATVDANNSSYGFTPQNCFHKIGGCAVSWLARITSIGGDPNGIVAPSDSYGPESPIVAAEPTTCPPGSSCSAGWIAGNSSFQYADILQDVVTGAAVEWQKLGLPNLLSTGSTFNLQAGTNQTTYLVRAYSGGVADSDESQNVWHSKYPDAPKFASAALGINIVQDVVDFINFSTLGVPKTLGIVNFFTCEFTDLVTDFVAGAAVEANATTPSQILSEYKTVLTSALGQTLSCAINAGLQALIKVITEAGAALTGIGTTLDAASQIGSAGASGGDVIQNVYELGHQVTAVETAVIAIAPGIAGGLNPTPSITSLSATSATAGSAPLPLTIRGKYLLSNSVVTFNSSPHQASLTSSGDLTITLSVTDLATPGTFSIVVTNPAPGGGASNAVNFTIQPAAATPTLLSLTLSATSVVGGNSVTGTMTLSGPALTSGAQVTLSSSNSSAQVPPSVTIASGQSSGTFAIGTTTVASTQTATITASLGTSNVTAVLTVSPGGSVPVSITEYNISQTFYAPTGISAGPDGALWFTELYDNNLNGNNIGRITTAGMVTEYGVAYGSSPCWITAGPDGALWFVELLGNKVGRITTAGVVTEYPVPTSGSNPCGIATGPDGALWFTEYLGNNIGRITMAGVITEYPVPTSGSNPEAIAAGPDGALWFTEYSGNKIGRITTAGSITEYPVPTPYSVPQGIAAGPDGALWFTEYYGNNIGRITTAGSITEYPVPTSSSTPLGIATGPDGALWFTEYMGNNIGRVATTNSTPALQGLSLTVATLTAGASTTGRVTLSGAAPSGGIQVSLSSNNSCVQVPATVSIAAGQSSATFTVTTTAVTSVQTVTITAKLGTSSQTAVVTVSPANSPLPQNFSLNGTLNIGGNSLGIQIIAGGGLGYYGVVLQQTGVGYPVSIEVGFSGITPSVSGNTMVFNGPVAVGLYDDESNLFQPVTIIFNSATLSLTFASPVVGGSVTGKLSFPNGSSTMQGTITGTITVVE